MAYLLDANVFIAAKRFHYGFDFCPGFWEWLIKANLAQVIFCIDEVVKELNNSKDELADWIEKHKKSFVIKDDGSLSVAYRAVSRWATEHGYTDAAINEFFQAADYHLVAHALAGKHAVVTYEATSTSQKRIKIPDTCRGLGVRCIFPHELYREENMRLVLMTD